jgi:hypothetical protein
MSSLPPLNKPQSKSKSNDSKQKTVAEVQAEILQRKLEIQAKESAKLTADDGKIVDLFQLPSFKKNTSQLKKPASTSSSSSSQTTNQPKSPISKITKKPMKLSNDILLLLI